MSIDLRSETTIGLSQVGNYLPTGRFGSRVSVSCALRWVLDGVRLRSGEVVRLEALRLGGRWITSVEALERFAARQTPVLDTERERPIRTPAARQRASARAARKLDESGI